MVLPFLVTSWQIPALMVIQGFVIGAIPRTIFAAAPEVMPRPEWAGLGLAVILIGGDLGNLVGPVLFGELGGSLGWVMAGYMVILVCLAGLVSG